MIPERIQSKRILVVDDDHHSSRITQSYLNAWGIKNDLAEDAESAIKILAESNSSHPFDLAILDLVMPGMDGLELAKRIREDEHYANTKLILVTGFDKPGLGEEAIEHGFNAYLTKPLKQSQLHNAICSVLNDEISGESWMLREAKAARSSLPPQLLPSRQELILVAEDHPINQEVILLLLADLGFEAHIANNGVEAVDYFSRGIYQLVFMDCQMPVMDGFQTTHELRKLESLSGKHIPIIAMTAHAIEGSKERCIEAGMSDYVSKPVDPQILRETLEKWLPATSRNDYKAQEPAVKSRRSLWDSKKLSNRLGEINLEKILRVFLAKFPVTSELDNKIAKGDYDAVAAEAHGLKGVFSSLCSESLKNLAGKLEASAQQNNASEVDAIFSEMKSLEAELKIEIQRILNLRQ